MTFEECFSELKDDQESAAECIHCLRKYGENILFSRERKRIILARELWDERPSAHMKKISEILGIDSIEKYQEMDSKFNLTMY